MVSSTTPNRRHEMRQHNLLESNLQQMFLSVSLFQTRKPYMLNKKSPKPRAAINPFALGN
jgi:hypothetical protein